MISLRTARECELGLDGAMVGVADDAQQELARPANTTERNEADDRSWHSELKPI